MDELELLKKQWKKQDKGLPKLSYDQIYQMILKKSSSIVKWIFIISLLEFALLISLEIIGRVNGNLSQGFEELGFGSNFVFVISVVSYSILTFFIIRFYLNYKKIKATDSAKILMDNILKTRRTVKYYVFINLSFLGIMLIFSMGYAIFISQEFISPDSGQELSKVTVFVIAVLVSVVVVAAIGLIYYLLYGRLTRRLKGNYKELQRLEI